jgi:TPR repeat protein
MSISQNKADLADNNTTYGWINTSGFVSGNIGTSLDTDWFITYLLAGVSYRVESGSSRKRGEPQKGKNNIKHILFFLVMAFASFSALAQDAEYQEMLRQAESRDAEAQQALGVMYENGIGVSENDQEAVKWSRLAAEQGLAGAQAVLGIMYDQV